MKYRRKVYCRSTSLPLQSLHIIMFPLMFRSQMIHTAQESTGRSDGQHIIVGFTVSTHLTSLAIIGYNTNATVSCWTNHISNCYKYQLEYSILCVLPVNRLSSTFSEPKHHVDSIFNRIRSDVTWQWRCLAQHRIDVHCWYCNNKKHCNEK